MPSCDGILLFEKNGTTSKLLKIVHKDNPTTLAEANGSASSIVLWGLQCGLDFNQQVAFEVIVSSFVLTFYEQANQKIGNSRTRNNVFFVERLKLMKLARRTNVDGLCLSERELKKKTICFLHGPGGSGKSAVLELFFVYAKDHCENIDENFTSHTIVKTAISGVAASLIGGVTTSSACFLNWKEVPKKATEPWEATRMFVVDEISMVSVGDFKKIEHRLRVLKDAFHKPFGGLNVILCGDMRQLEPPQKTSKPLYDDPELTFLRHVNCYVELNGMHRFDTDPQYGLMMRRMREGALTQNDLDVINSQVVDSDAEIIDDIRYATYMNKDRASINIALFRKYIETYGNNTTPIDDVIAIFASEVHAKNGSNVYEKKNNSWESYFFEHCGEADCVPTGRSGRFDPVLLLFLGRPIMLTDNIDVAANMANGSRLKVRQVSFKPGKHPKCIKMCGRVVNAARACHVEKISVEHEDIKGPNRFFAVEPKVHYFTAKFLLPRSLQTTKYVRGREKLSNETENIQMKAMQFPVVCNNATTGHKLQGTTMTHLFIHAFSKLRNWSYVVLSRVKTLNGLFSRKRLEKRDLDAHNFIPDKLIEMIENLRDVAPKSFTQEECNKHLDIEI